MATLETGASSTTNTVETRASSSATVAETRASTDDMFTVKKFQECTDAWRDENNWPSGMETILRKARVFEFLFGMVNFDSKEIDNAILKYDVGNMELRIFGTRVYINPNLVSQATKIPRRGGGIFSSWKSPKLEKNQMANKFCEQIVSFPRNGLRM